MGVGIIVAGAIIGCAEEKRHPADATRNNQTCEDFGKTTKTVDIPGGTYRVGEDRFYREEGPVRTVKIEAFNIDATEVTNREFSEFVAATGYLTRAERGLTEEQFSHIPEELRKPGSAVFTPPENPQNLSAGNWWRFVEGASWRMPNGPGSTVDGLESHPVVHVAFEDAEAYAAWKGRRLPTEIEWEAAARGRENHAPYSWGETPPDKLEKSPANIWQGIFPVINQKIDGYAGAAPVGCFEPNVNGLYDMIGNVWEMTSTNHSPDAGVIKGGSYLCAENYCLRYRPAARQSQEFALGSSHIGFRTAK